MNGRFFAMEATLPPAPRLACGEDCDCEVRGNDLGCKKCQDGRRKRKKRQEQAQSYIPDTSTMPVSQWNLEGPRMMRGDIRHELGHQALGQTCPLTAPTSWPSDLNCQRDARGNAVCSNGMYFPPGCPHTPPDEYFSGGIAPDEVVNGVLQAKAPAPRGGLSTVVGGSPVATAAVGIGILGAVGTAIYFLVR